MHRRIEKEGVDEYNRIKELAKTNDNFKPYLEWFEGREFTVSEHEKTVRKKFTALHNSEKPSGGTYRYSDIADIAGCNSATVSMVMNGGNQLSKELADEILKNLHEAEQALQKQAMSVQSHP